jgi:hypothetical protein
MSPWKWAVAAAATLIGSLASAAGPVDPAMTFVGRMMAGEADTVAKLVLEPVVQGHDFPVIRGKTTITVREFLNAVSGCKVLRMENLAPSMGPYEVPAELNVIWDCGSSGLAARVRSIAYNVEVSQFEKRLFTAAPPPVPSPAGK